MNVIYGVPVVHKTLKLSLDEPEQSNETFSQMICEYVLKVSKTSIITKPTQTTYKLNYWLNQNLEKTITEVQSKQLS